MRKTKVFVDSDVIISSLLSENGAAHLLLNKQGSNFIISTISQKEIVEVARRLNIKQEQLENLIKKNLKVFKLKKDVSKIKEEFEDYTNDVNDTHIVAGASSYKAKFLLTYNLKDFQRQKIKEDLGIIVLTPSQY